METKKKQAIIILTMVLLVAAAVGAWAYFSKSNQLTNNNQTNVNGGETGGLISDTKNQKSFYEYDPGDLVYSGQAPVYVTVYSHNEETWSYKVNTEIKYRDYRAGLVERAQVFSDYGIDWDWQTDQPVVEAMIKYEGMADLLALTDGKNILQYLESKGASLDPHSHNLNYADIVYLMKQLGAKASGVIGGTIVVECGSEYLGFLDFDSWRDNVEIQADGYVHGEEYPSALWKPTVLSDPGMGQHWFDDWSSGVWQPGDASSFLTHDPDNEIIYIGEGYPHDTVLIGTEHAGGSEVYNIDGQYIKELVEKIANKELPTGTKDGERFMYTASIHVRDMAMVDEDSNPVNTIEGLNKIFAELKPLKDSGKIIFADFETVAKVWQTEYNSVPWRIDLSSFSFYDETKQQAEEYCVSAGSDRKNSGNLPPRSR